MWLDLDPLFWGLWSDRRSIFSWRIVIGFLDPKIMDRIENDRIFFLDPFWTKNSQICLKMKNKFSYPIIFHKQTAFLRLKLAFPSKITILWDLAIPLEMNLSILHVLRLKKHKICGIISLSIHYKDRIGMDRKGSESIGS